MMRFGAVFVLLAIVCLGAWAPISAQPERNQSHAQVTQVHDLELDVDEASMSASEESADESSDDADEPEEAAKEKSESADAEKLAAKEESDDKADAKDAEKKDKEPAEAKTEAKPKDKADAKPAAKKEPKKRKTHKVDTKRMKVDVPLEGVFVANKTTEVPFRPEVWTDYEIVEVAKLGAKVRQGETLFKFDDKKLNETIADLELDQKLNELSIMRTEQELPRMEKTLTMDLAAAERRDKQAKEDFDRYNQIDRPMYVKSAEFVAKYYGFMLDYEKDELDQLEKMYKADDLTEDTEEIVLRRQRNSVEFAEFNLENARLNRDETLNIRLPRYDIEIKESLETAGLALERAKMASQLDLNRARYDLEQRKETRRKSLDRYAKLLVDRGLMEVKAPADGIVYYGKANNGRWSETPQLINKYEPKNNVTPGAVLMTIVDPRPLRVTALFDEGKRPDIAVGQKAKVSPPSEGASRINAKVTSISPIEVAPGKFELDLELTGSEVPDWVVAGMNCKFKINTFDKADALTIPKAALRTDKDDEDQQYVWIVDPDDAEAKPERRNVKVGQRSGDDIEIVKGLKQGDVISLEDEDKADKADKDGETPKSKD